MTGPYDRPLRQAPATGPCDKPRARRGGLGWTARQSGRLRSPNYSQRNTGDRAPPRGASLKDIAEGHTTEKRAQERRSLKKSSMSRAHSSARTPAYTSGAGATRPSRSTS